MRPALPRLSLTSILLSLALATHARAEDLDAQIEALRKSIADTQAEANRLKRELERHQRRVRELRESPPAARLDNGSLDEQRGRGADGAAAPTPPTTPPTTAPQATTKPPAVAPIFEAPGVLTPRGRYVLEPSVNYAYASSNRVALVGYTIIPALLIGLIDVREVKRNTVTAALTGRLGITNRFEIEAKVPYVYRSDSAISRRIASPDNITEGLFQSNGEGLGDVELTGRYQLNAGGADKPYYVASLRVKSRTGKDPFEVITATAVPGGLTNQLQRSLPTGSGFYTLQPGLTVLYPTDPGVFFGGVSYQHNIERKNLSLKTDEGPQAVGDIQPGGVIGFNFGLGLALNERSSFSIGYDHSSIGRTKQNGQNLPESVRTQIGSLLLGYSQRLSNATTLNLSVGVGVTRDSPDVQITLRLPMTF